MKAAKLILDGAGVSYGGKPALADISFEVGEGELTVLLGPSGCGKTTLLKAVAGLLPLSCGSVFIGGRRVDALPPQERGAAMIFQHYALFPHLSVAENAAYGLKIRGAPKRERERRAAELLSLVDLEGFGGRRVHTLSGGQQQRVAIARALAVDPDVLLLDEPLSSLDQRLRVQMRGDIRAILASRGTTALYVTHDQEEAMEIADRIVVMKDGRVEQIARPADLYRNPASEFVARFLGHRNILDVRIADGRVSFLGSAFAAAVPVPSGPVRVLVPEQAVRLYGEGGAAAPPPGTIAVRAVVETAEARADLLRYRLRVGGTELGAFEIDRPGARFFEPGSVVALHIDASALRVFPG